MLLRKFDPQAPKVPRAPRADKTGWGKFGVFDLAPAYLWFCCTHAHKFMQPVSCFSGQVRVMPTGGKPLCPSQTWLIPDLLKLSLIPHSGCLSRHPIDNVARVSHLHSYSLLWKLEQSIHRVKEYSSSEAQVDSQHWEETMH